MVVNDPITMAGTMREESVIIGIRNGAVPGYPFRNSAAL